MNFGQALEELKQGGKVAREGWNGKGMFIFLQEGSHISSDDARNRHLSEMGSMDIEIKSHIDMKAADGSVTIGWNPSQVDILAEDWQEVK